MTLRNEPAIANAGAVVVEVFAIMIQIMVGIVVIRALCTQRYDKDESLNKTSFADDIRRLSTSKMTDYQFDRKLIRYARYSLSCQWLSYFICHILILTHEFVTEIDIVDHIIYIAFIINLTFLFLTFRNVGIYYFLPFTNEKNFPNPLIQSQKEREEQKAQFDVIEEEKKYPDKTDPKEDSVTDAEFIQSGHNCRDEIAGHRFSHHHYQDPDLMPDPTQSIQKTGNQDFDAYNAQRLDIRINLVHLFRCIAYTSIIFWVGYVVAAVHGSNNVILATIALADILYILLVAAHMHYVHKLIRLLETYQSILIEFDDECDKRRADRLFQLDRWFRADIGIIIVLLVKCIVLLVAISISESSFSWPSSHPVFLATTFVIICSCQMTCCRYIWLTKTD